MTGININLESECPAEYNLTKDVINLYLIAIETTPHFSLTDQMILVSTTFAKIYVSFQATIQLCQHNFPYDSFPITRSMFETLCILKYAVKNEDFAKEYASSFQKKQLRTMNKILMYKEIFPEEMTDFVTTERRDKLNNTVQENSIKEFRIEEMAKKADLHQLYLTFYSIASDYTHSSISNLSNYLTFDLDEVSINYAPTILDIRETLLNANYLSLLAINAFVDLMKIKVTKEEIESHEAELVKLFEILNSEKYS